MEQLHEFLVAGRDGVTVYQGVYDPDLKQMTRTNPRPATYHDLYNNNDPRPYPRMSTFSNHWDDTEPRMLDHWLEGDSSPALTEPTNEMINEIEPGQSGSHNTHSRLSPSDSKRWVNCTASINATAHIPKDESVFASEGTDAHNWAEAVLNKKCIIDDVPEAFRQYIKFYVDHCLSLVPAGETPFIESQVPLFYMPSESGTLDFGVVTSQRVTIRDYKHGAGVLVDAEDNPQLAIYALSLVEDQNALYDFDPSTIIDIGIVQPRHRECEDIRTWVLTLADLRLFCRDIEYAAIQIQTGRGLEFRPDHETCRWCPKAWKVKCPARVKSLTDPFDLPDLSGVDLLADLPDLTKEEKKLPAEERIAARVTGEPLDDATLAAMYKGAKGIRAFLDDIEEVIEMRVLAGETFDGEFKICDGRSGNRAWADEDAADKWLQGQKLKQEERYNFKVISPTQAEKLLADKLESSTRTAKRFAELVSRSAGRPVVALASDKRPAIAAGIDLLPDLTELSDEEL